VLTKQKIFYPGCKRRRSPLLLLITMWSSRPRKRVYAQRSRSRTPARPVRPYKKSRAITKRSYARSLASARGVGLAAGLKTQLKTTFFYNATASASGVWTGTLKTGSCFDPCGTLANIQPAEYDQWCTMFGRYVVTGGSVKVTVVPQGTLATGVSGFVACMYPDIDAAAKADYQAAASQDWSVKGVGGQGQSPVVLYQRFSHAALLGKKGPVTSEDNGALYNSDPVANQFINHQLFLQWSGNAPILFLVHVEIVQDVYFDRRITVDTE